MEDLTLMSENELHKELRRHAKEAIDVQDAVNLSGVVYAFARSMQLIFEISSRINEGTAWRNHHPVAVMYANKISSLCEAESAGNYSDAYERCKVLTELDDQWA
jgi:hypothetical protein